LLIEQQSLKKDMKIIMQYLLPRKIYTIFFVCIALVGTGFTIHEGMGRKTYRDCGIVKEKLVKQAAKP